MGLNTSDDHLVDADGDLNTALLRWLNLRSGVAHADIARLHQDFLNSRTSADSSRALVEELDGAAGKETT